MTKWLLTLLLAASTLGLAQTIPCNFSNTGASSGTVSVNTASGFSMPNGVGAVGFRLPVACMASYVGYFVVNTDASPNNNPKVYDIGLYCQAGDCQPGRLYVHTGPIAGRNFTNNRVAVSALVAVSAQANGPVKFSGTGQFPNAADWPPGIQVTVTPAKCQTGGSTFNLATWNHDEVDTVQTSPQTFAQSGCTLSAKIPYPPNFNGTTVCNNSNALNCMMVLPWVHDANTACSSIPCLLPAGIYAAAIGTDCSSADPLGCAQLKGDADMGKIYPFTAAPQSSFDKATGLSATITMTVSNSSAVWNTAPDQSRVKPVKLLLN